MSGPAPRIQCVVALAAALVPWAAFPARTGAEQPPAVAVAGVVPNDNRVPAGTRRGGLLPLSLVARAAEWHPDGDDAPGAPMQAFAEEGGVARIPGPLVRVPAGTAAAVRVRNALADTLRLYGLHDRPRAGVPDTTPLVLAPGASHAVRFRLDVPGTFYYWGTTTRRALSFRTGLDAQLTGAIVVDPTGARPPPDRVLVLGMWTDTVARALVPRRRVLGVINGRSFPAAETLRYAVGDTARLRVINASGDLHPMHLHGFYFRVTERGDGVTDTLLAPAVQPLAVTEALSAGATATLVWVPERAGNWLFHCHIPEHFGPRDPLGMPRNTASPHAAHATSQATSQATSRHGMSGLVVGIVVRPAASATRLTAARPPTRTPEPPRRHLRLLVRPNVGSTDAAPLFGYAWHEAGAEPPPDSGRHAAPTVVLRRGEPVRITVVNRLAEPTAVHWHGIELASYYDGVPGYSGMGRRVTPMIAPGDSFVVRFTPPRAGTFIYHTHADEERQQDAGLAGPLLVLAPGARWDPARDIPVLIGSSGDFDAETRALAINGRVDPPPLRLEAGRAHRLRLINMSARRGWT